MTSGTSATESTRAKRSAPYASSRRRTASPSSRSFPESYFRTWIARAPNSKAPSASSARLSPTWTSSDGAQRDCAQAARKGGARGFVREDIRPRVVRGEAAAAPDEVDDVGAQHGVGSLRDGGALHEGHADGVEDRPGVFADRSRAGVRADVRHVGELERGLDHPKGPHGLQAAGRAEVVEVPEDGHGVAHAPRSLVGFGGCIGRVGGLGRGL